MKIKQLDKLVLTGFIGPYLLSFFVAEFVLIMQFLWKNIDDILGKGFSVIDLCELIFYFGIAHIPMALPIAILISSVMVFGDMSEKYELSSMKSAGVSLLRIMRPAIMLAIFTFLLSLLASNYLKPQAYFQYNKRFRAMRAQKSSLAIEEKIFNRDFTGYAIRVQEKNEKTKGIKDVLIYDHTASDKSLVNFTTAEKGKMYNSDDGRYFIMELEDGTSYVEMKRERKKSSQGKKYPFMRTDFKNWEKVFDMSQFDADDNSVALSKSAEKMLNTFQLFEGIDSMAVKKQKHIESVLNAEKQEAQKEKEKVEDLKREDRFNKVLQNSIKNATNTQKKDLKKVTKRLIKQNQTDSLGEYEHWYETIDIDDKNNLFIKAVQSSGRRKDLLRNAVSNIKTLNRKQRAYRLALHQQYAFAMICILFLFVGAPLGSIIRKGGYGYPLLIAILFYMVFIISSIMGEKLVGQGSWLPFFGGWVSNFLILPAAIWFTYMALTDRKFAKSSALFERIRFFNRLINQ